MKDLEKKIDDLTEAFNKFKLGCSVDIALLKQESKRGSQFWGTLAGGIISIVISVAAFAIRGTFK